jgi:hypothetical protein
MQRETMARVDDIGRRFSVDRARQLIYEDNYRVYSKAVERVLGDKSLVPTAVSCVYLLRAASGNDIYTRKSQNAFSDRLFSVGFNFYSMLLPDLMHEVEIGWKAIFVQLLRMLQSIDKRLLVELDRR